MSKETRSIDKKGFSNKFFEELDKEHDNAKEFAKRQKELKEKKKKQSWFWLFYTDFTSSLQPDWDDVPSASRLNHPNLGFWG